MDLLMVVLENMRDEILDQVKNIEPVDETERLHIDDVLSWIQGPSDIFRIAKPDSPPKHLVSYFVVYDPRVQKLMLIDHVKANMWLPSGGHVEIDEHPRETVRREAMEELELVADFRVIGEEPAFITVTETRGPGTHTDVSFWYVIVGDSTAELNYDKREMRGLKWLSFDEVLTMDDRLLDPHMKRFVRKFSRMLHE
jgi:8-oxo-dGTP pyrophosphatase MutT (NUDIX family)